MYSEKNTFEDIMARSLERISDDIDKREGSVIYDALSPVAAELAQIYIVLDDLIDLVYPDTAIDTYLDRLVEQMGMKRNEATKAIRKGIFWNENNELMDIDLETRFSIDELEYIVIEKIAKGEYQLECTTSGTVGNIPTGILLPVEYNIKNLGLAQLTDILVPGEDKESDDELRERYYDYINEKGFGGNIADYRNKTKAIDGVGAVKVIPVWNGGGTVKLIILDSEYNKASDILVEKVQEEICPDFSDKGLGIAPVGHVVTVESSEEFTVNIELQLTLSSTVTLSQIKDLIIQEIENYLLSLRKNWELSDSIIIRKAQIESRILDVEGVLDIVQTTINGMNTNIEIVNNCVPILGEVNVL